MAWWSFVPLALDVASSVGSLFQKDDIDPFRFNPDPNDPEIDLRKRRTLLDAERRKRNMVNELARSGLLGSGTGFDILNEGESDTARILDDIDNIVYGKQRGEQLDLYKMNQGFKQTERNAGLGALGGIGSDLGYALDDIFSPNTESFNRHVRTPRMGEAGFRYPIGRL